MKIDIREFFGTAPKRDKELLDPRAAQVALNTKLWSGKLRAWNTNLFEYTPVGTTPVLSIYKHADAYWFESEKDVNWVPGPINNDGGYVYSTDGVGYPAITNTSLATTGLGAYPRGSRRLGLPVPAAPTVAMNETTGTITDISGIKQESNGANIIATVTDSALVTFTVFGIVETTVRQVGSVEAKIFVDGVAIASKKVPLSFSSARPGEPQLASYSITVSKQYKPDADGSFTFSFTTGFFDLESVTVVNETKHAEVKQYGAVLVTVNAGHGLVKGDMVKITNAGGMGDFNDKKYTILKVVDTNKLLIPTDTTETYTAGGAWEKIYSVDETESRAYVFTYISDFNGLVMEGPVSASSEVIELFPKLGATVTFPAAPDAAWNVTGVRLYRTVVNSANEAEFLFVKELAGAQPAAYSDSALSADLGEPISTDTYIAPPFAMKGLVNLDNGALVGFSGRTLYPCEPFQPHAYPAEYQKTTSFDIVALAAIGGSTCAVLTDGCPYVLNGRHPADFSLERIDTSAACLSKRAAVDMGYAVVYPSDSGLISLTIGRADVITGNLFERDEWQEHKPSSMIAARYDNRYVCFYDKGGGDKGGFVLDPREPNSSLTFLDFHATAVWTDPKSGDLYAVVGGDIVKFDAGAGSLTYTWRSKRFVWPREGSPSVACVVADSYPVTLKCYMMIENVLTERWSVSVTSADPFRVKAGVLVDEIELQVSGTGTVRRVQLAESFDELRDS